MKGRKTRDGEIYKGRGAWVKMKGEALTTENKKDLLNITYTITSKIHTLQ